MCFQIGTFSFIVSAESKNQAKTYAGKIKINVITYLHMLMLLLRLLLHALQRLVTVDPFDDSSSCAFTSERDPNSWNSCGHGWNTVASLHHCKTMAYGLLKSSCAGTVSTGKTRSRSEERCACVESCGVW